MTRSCSQLPQTVSVHLPVMYGVQAITPPGQDLQQRRLVPLAWHQDDVQASARADGSSSPSAALLSFPMEFRMIQSAFPVSGNRCEWCSCR
jgi:hypothetical protein